jgi:hypothetical protein
LAVKAFNAHDLALNLHLHDVFPYPIHCTCRRQRFAF